MNYKYITYYSDVPVGVITLNNPKKRNALSLELLRELGRCLDIISADNNIKSVIIKAAGPVFSAGHDISEMADKDLTFYNEVLNTCSSVMLKIQNIPQPVIAQVQGIATAAGCQLVAACDLALAEEGAMFGTPGVKLGLFCTTPAIPLVRAIGRKRALEMLFTGRVIGAREAEHYGLINKAIPATDLETETLNLAKKIAEASRLTLGIGKKSFYSQVNMIDQQAYTYCNQVVVNNLFADDAKEGLHAFLEKRKPVWRNK